MKNRRTRWTFRVLIKSTAITDFDSDIQIDEEMVTFDSILATEEEIENILKNAFIAKGRFSLIFPKTYVIQSFHTPVNNLVHVTILREGKKTVKQKSGILDEVNRIIEG